MQPGQGRPGWASSTIAAHSRRSRVTAAATLAAVAGLAAAFTLQAIPARAAVIIRPGAARGSARPAVTSGSLRAWGFNRFGALGTGNTAAHFLPVRVRLPAGTKVTVVRSTCDHTLAVTRTGSVLAWGLNRHGGLGNGSTRNSRTPVRVALPRGMKVSAVRAGCDFSLALTSTGRVLAWGDGEDGDLGDGSTTQRLRPVLVKLPAGVKVKAISVGDNTALALTTNGDVLAWGEGTDGQLGNGAVSNRQLPVRVKLPARAKASAIAAGSGTGFAVTSAGTFAWGVNNDGQLGVGDTTSRKVPARIVVPAGVRSAGKISQLAAGSGQTYALTAKGKVLAWGDNPFGELGNNTDISSMVPVRVMLPPGTRATSVSASEVSGFALTASGHVLAWGGGLLGNGTQSDSFVPVQVMLASSLRATAIGSGPESNSVFAIVSPR